MGVGDRRQAGTLAVVDRAARQPRLQTAQNLVVVRAGAGDVQ